VTPDGIATEDWDRVHELAADIVNASAAEDEAAGAAVSGRLLEWLEELLRRYGPLPSILATRADYVGSNAEREYLLLAAYEQAEQRGDRRNLAWVASSLAGLYVEELRDVAEGQRWLGRLARHVQACPEANEADELARLTEVASGARGRRTRR
jgi:hypothetical protein